MLQELMVELKTIIAALTETHLTPDILDAEVNIDGYHLFRADRAGRQQGGVGVYIVDNLAADTSVVSTGSNGVTEHIVLYIRKVNIIIINIYRPPAALFSDFSPVISEIRDKVFSFGEPTPEILICGDFNFPGTQWASGFTTGGSVDHRRQASLMIDLQDDLLLSQIIDVPTRGENILDLVFTNEDMLIMSTEARDTLLSDHRLIIIETMLGFPEVSGDAAQSETGLNALNFYSAKTKWDSITRELVEINWLEALQGKNVTDMFNVLLQKLNCICTKYTPRKLSCFNKQSIPRDRKILMRKKSKLHKKLVRNPPNRQKLIDTIHNLEERLVLSHINEQERQEEEAVQAIRTNSKFFFKYAKKKSEIRTAIGPLKRGEVLIGDPAEMSEILRVQYESVFSTPLQAPTPTAVVGNAENNELRDICMRPEDFVEAATGLRTNSAPGPDGVSAVLLKKTIGVMAVPLNLIWQESMRLGVIPQCLKVGKVTPIFKGGDRSLPKNYRPVVLTSHCIKLFERILVKFLGQFMDEGGLYNEHQHGFRAGRSCLSQLLMHHQDILEILASSMDVDVVYLDFAKAFDKVDHGVLLSKLQGLGVRGNLLRWLTCFLDCRKQYIAVNGAYSSESLVISGVPQGSVLGPVLFLIHISDINCNILHTTVRSFADDTRVTIPIKSEDDCCRMQADLDTIYEWAAVNNMEFNGCKFELLRYTVSGDPVEFIYKTMEGIDINRTMKTTDLGIVMSDSASFREQISVVATRARQRMGWILRVFITRERIPMLTLYRSLVLPLLEYCCALWSPGAIGMIRRLESVQRTFTVRVHGMSQLDYWERLQELNMYSLERRRERYAIIYVWKILQGLTPNLGHPAEVLASVGGRRGKMCRVPPINNRATQRVQSLQENSLAVRGPRLFNCLSAEVREYDGSLDGFKHKLDRFLSTVPDKPCLPNYYQAAEGNSIIKQIAQIRTERATEVTLGSRSAL